MKRFCQSLFGLFRSHCLFLSQFFLFLFLWLDISRVTEHYDVSRSEILDAINALEKVVDGGSKVKLAEIKDFVSYEMKHPAQCDQEKLTTALRKLKTCMVAEVEPNEVLSDVKILFMKA